MNPLRIEDISWTQRARMLAGFLGVVRNIERTNDVFKVSEKIPDTALLPAIEQVKKGPWGATALIERPLVRPDLSELAKLPVGTFGREYADLMLRRGLSPDFYPAIAIESEAKYYRVHLYQTHDFWHVVTGFRADPAGELGLQAFYYAQTEMPLPILLLAAGLLNAALFDPADVSPRLGAITRGYQLGRSAKTLFGFPWALHWETPLREVRSILGIVSDSTALPEQVQEQVSPVASEPTVEAYAGAH